MSIFRPKMGPLGLAILYIGALGIARTPGSEAAPMGPPVVPPIIIESVDDWEAFQAILASSEFSTAASSQWGSNYVGPVQFGKVDGIYVGYFNWCPGKRVSWEYTPAQGSVSATTNVASCNNNQAPRVEDEDCYGFLEFVLAEQPSGLVGELASGAVVDFFATRNGSAFEIAFVFRPDSGASDYTKTASATLSGGQFGSITVN